MITRYVSQEIPLQVKYVARHGISKVSRERDDANGYRGRPGRELCPPQRCEVHYTTARCGRVCG